MILISVLTHAHRLHRAIVTLVLSCHHRLVVLKWCWIRHGHWNTTHLILHQEQKTWIDLLVLLGLAKVLLGLKILHLESKRKWMRKRAE